jgi:hypothetical protein
MQARTATRREGGIGSDPLSNEAAYRSFAFTNVETSDISAFLPIDSASAGNPGGKAKSPLRDLRCGLECVQRLVQ